MQVTITERYFVDCKTVSGELLRTYDFLVTKDAAALLDEVSLINEAKNNLTTEGIANPPYVGLGFHIYR